MRNVKPVTRLRPWAACSAAAVAVCLTAVAPAKAQLEVTEVMYNPTNDGVWEWIEVRNTGAVDIDLDGWLGFNLGDGELTAPNPTIVSNTNSPNTMIKAGEVAVIYDGFHGQTSPGSFDDSHFRNAWGLSASTPLLAASFWPGLSNSEGSPSQSIGFWANLADYQADLVDDGSGEGTREIGSFANAQFSINYSDAAYPGADGRSSITWSGQGDRNNGANWVRSQSGVGGAVVSVPVTLGIPTNNINEVANPGLVTSTGSAPNDNLMFTELLYDSGAAQPESTWEWIEVHNPSGSAVDLAGYVIDDINGAAHDSANIASGSIAPGGTAILFNADANSEADFATAWGGSLNLVPVSNWGAMELNNGGDTVSLWSDFASYSGDNETHANAILTLTYTDDPDFPDSNNMSSITLNNLGADPANGLSWDLSFIGDAVGSFNPGPVGNVSDFHPGDDVGSPGEFQLQDLLLADADDDNKVEGDDFLAIQQFDSGLIAAWQAEFGAGVVASAAVGAVPEPASLALLAVAALSCATRSRRR